MRMLTIFPSPPSHSFLSPPDLSPFPSPFSSPPPFVPPLFLQISQNSDHELRGRKMCWKKLERYISPFLFPFPPFLTFIFLFIFPSFFLASPSASHLSKQKPSLVKPGFGFEKERREFGMRDVGVAGEGVVRDGCGGIGGGGGWKA